MNSGHRSHLVKIALVRLQSMQKNANTAEVLKTNNLICNDFIKKLMREQS